MTLAAMRIRLLGFVAVRICLLGSRAVRYLLQLIQAPICAATNFGRCYQRAGSCWRCPWGVGRCGGGRGWSRLLSQSLCCACDVRLGEGLPEPIHLAPLECPLFSWYYLKDKCDMTSSWRGGRAGPGVLGRCVSITHYLYERGSTGMTQRTSRRQDCRALSRLRMVPSIRPSRGSLHPLVRLFASRGGGWRAADAASA